jgi:hypothetical protein
LILLVVFYAFASTKYTHVVSTIDNQEYKVKNDENAQASADALAKINRDINILIAYIKSLDNPPDYSKRLRNYNKDSLRENIWDIDTTYTINKGQEITFCLTPRDDKYPKEVYPHNLLMYVAIHELAHVVSISTGHNEEFKRNFDDLLKHSVDAGVYKDINFKKTPKEYCGIYIDS